MSINLVHKETKKVLKVGDKVSDFRGDQGVITHMSPPKHSGSSGKIVLKYNDDDMGRELFATVINAEFVEVSDGR